MGILSNLLDFFGRIGHTILWERKDELTFQEQFETFEELGFTLNEHITVSDIIDSEGGEEAFESEPYYRLYIALGRSLEEPPWSPFTNKCWTLDVEAIEDEGSYPNILENITRVTGGDFVFENVQHEFDFDADEDIVWLSFTFRGNYYNWDLVVDNDWVDENLFAKVQALAEEHKTKGRFTYFHTDSQCFVLGYHTEEELELIKQKTGLKIVWLKT